MVDGIIARGQVSTSKGNRKKYTIAPDYSPLCKKCGRKNCQYIGDRGVKYFYKCNHCGSVFPVREK
jgi:hypothetical protein